MRPARFLDTNILLYSISSDPREARKREIAIALLDRSDNALSVQVLQEFYVQATRPTRAHAMSHGIATGLIRTWLRFPVQDITIAVLSSTLTIKQSAGLSYWDAAILAAAKQMGCREVISEDMTHGRDISGVMIVNPFR